MPITSRNNSDGARRQEWSYIQLLTRDQNKENFILNFILSFCKEMNYKSRNNKNEIKLIYRIEIRIIVITWWEEGLTGKRIEGTFWRGGEWNIFYILILVWITWVYAFVRSHPTVYLLSVYFTMYNHTSIKREKENKWQ